jgi:hypothetical protein
VDTLGDLADIENIEQLEVEGLEGKALKRWQQLARRQEGENGPLLSDLRLGLMIREPQVHFKGNGRMVVRGYIQLFRWRLPLRFVIAPRAGDGRLVLDFVAGRLGPLSLPEGLFDLIGKGLSRIILAGQDYAEIQEITVSEGTLTVRGRYDRETIGRDLCIVC